jgi:hypothetical protein
VLTIYVDSDVQIAQNDDMPDWQSETDTTVVFRARALGTDQSCRLAVSQGSPSGLGAVRRRHARLT